MRPDIEVRMAENTEGEIVGMLAARAGFQEDYVDWTNIFPYWLVAIYESRIIGTIQVCPGGPIGRLEILYVMQDVPTRVRKLATYMLLEAGARTLKLGGAQVVGGIVSFDMKYFKNFLRKRGAVTALTGNLLMWRV